LLGHSLPGSRGNYFDVHDVDAIAQKYMKANFNYETLDLKSELTQRDKTIQELQLRVTQYETAASQSKTEMTRRDEAVRKLAAKFAEATRRLEELERRLKDR
jgi:predicted RNase H-like nuclease (RuvC/YqgF family)